MTRRRPTTIPGPRWDYHEKTIRRLYLKEKRPLEGRQGVLELMKQHGLSASKAQFELQFKKWGYRKYLKKKEWHIIGHVIEERARRGLHSSVFFFDENLSEAKVRKEITRYKDCEDECTTCSTTVNRCLPKGVEIRSNAQQHKDSSSTERAESSSIVQGPEEEVPGLENPRNIWSGADDTPLRVQNSDYDTAGGSDDGGDQPMQDLVIKTTPSIPEIGTSIWTLVPSRLPTPSSTFEADATLLLSDFLDLRQLTPASMHGVSHNIPLNTTSLTVHLKTSALQDFEAACLRVLSATDPCVNKTMRLLPWKAQQDLQTTSDTVIVKQILFLLMNNFVGSYHAAFDTLFEQVKRFSMAQMKDILDAIPAPYSTALQQSILTIAIKSGVSVIINVLLQRGLDIERTTCRFANESFTPLGLACKFRRLEIVKTLVNYGVDVNQVDFSTQMTAMGHLIGLDHSSIDHNTDFSSESHEILRLLLDAEAEVGWRELENPYFWEDKPLLQIYLEHATMPTKFRYGYQIHKPLTNAMRLCGQAEATAAIKKMLGSRKAVVHLYESDISERCMEAFQHASYQGNASLVDYFLSIGLHPDLRCLCQAVRGNHFSILQEYIGIGANFDVVEGSDHHSRNLVRRYAGRVPADAEPLLYTDISIRYGKTTPFAESVRWQHHDLIQMFEEMGIFETITEGERFSAALFAAAEAGNKRMVERLLERATDVPELITTSLSPCISIATLGNHEEIVMMLMSAGIKPITSSITMAILIRKVRLIELFLDVAISIVDTFGLLYLAVRWGNVDVIKSLIRAGAPLNESGCDLGIVELEDPNIIDRTPLGEAIFRGNDEIVKLLLDSGAQINRCKSLSVPSPLSVAIESGQDRLVRDLLARGADPNDSLALSAAALHSADMTSLILGAFRQRYPSSTMYFASSALRQAIKDENEVIVRLLANYTDLDEKERRREDIENWHGVSDSGRLRAFLPSPLGEAIMTKNPSLVRILLDSGADPNSTVATELPFPQNGRWPALSMAIWIKSLPIVEILHGAGANLHYPAASRITHTPLQLAVETGQFDIVEFLLDRGADVNSAPCFWGGGTALQLAACQGFVGIAEMLLLRGANVNAPGSMFQGRTAFEGAAEHGRMDMLLLLYHNGVDIVFEGSAQVERAIRFAERNGQLAARDLVRELGESAELAAIMAL